VALRDRWQHSTRKKSLAALASKAKNVGNVKLRKIVKWLLKWLAGWRVGQGSAYVTCRSALTPYQFQMQYRNSVRRNSKSYLENPGEKRKKNEI
jgi:hypothetical protein